MKRDRNLIFVERLRGTDNVRISGVGFSPVVKMLGSNSGVSIDNIIDARKRLIKKKGGNPKVIDIYGFPKDFY